MKSEQTAKVQDIIAQLKSRANPANVAGMARFGINAHHTLGVSMVELRGMAKKIGRDHVLARQLWASGIHEARILAALIGEPEQVTGREMEEWVKDFDSWDVCDQVCSNLFDKTKSSYRKAAAWSRRQEEFVKRAGFVLVAAMAVHDKTAPDERFLPCLAWIEREAEDDRNFVRKAVNWALRQIGKRNRKLNQAALVVARRLAAAPAKSARWIGSDAVRELSSEAVQKKFCKKCFT